MMIYICTKFHENILNGIELRSGHKKLTDGRADGQTRHNTTRLRWAYQKNWTYYVVAVVSVRPFLTFHFQIRLGMRWTSVTILFAVVLQRFLNIITALYSNFVACSFPDNSS